MPNDDRRSDAGKYAGTYGGHIKDDPALQTRLESLAEAWINVALGFWINFTANMLILPLFGFTTLTLGTNFAIGMVYTVISVARSYIIRRWAQAHLRAARNRIAALLLRVV